MKRILSGLCGFLLLLGFDQWTKWMAYHFLKNAGEIPVIGNIFVFQYLENQGAAFGILQNQQIFLIVLTAVILIAIVFAYCKMPDNKRLNPLRILTVMLAAGAVGNMLDRILHRYVIDFLYFKLINFPIFNVADCYVVIAAVVAAILIMFYYKEEDFKVS